MPIYEYVCSKCNHHLEALQKLSDDPLVFCPECGEAELRKKISAAAFRLKGTGWYETDFKNSGKGKSSDSKTDSSDSSKASASSGESSGSSGKSSDSSSGSSSASSDKSSGSKSSPSASKSA